MSCKDCIHYGICTFHLTNDEYKKCCHFKTTEEVVEVVRCIDCEYWDGRGYDGRCEAPMNGLIRDYTNYDDFCSYGERKEQE